ncbi:MAG: sulfotransferase [Luteolibacter sp.]
MTSPAGMSPVIVLSPLQRSGTTLIQRLLCSAPNALIYGDTVGQEAEFFAKYAMARGQMIGFQQSQIAPVLEAVLRGDVSDFITPLAPTMSTYLASFRAAAVAWLDGCRREAAEASRPIWGWKLAGADATSLPTLAQWFPQARWIWIDRDITDSMRSAKAAQMFSSPAEAGMMARQAQFNRQIFTNLKLGNLLTFDYAEMLKNPASTVASLEEFTGAKGISPAVFDRRVNDYGNPNWVPPATLTDEESAAIQLNLNAA